MMNGILRQLRIAECGLRIKRNNGDAVQFAIRNSQFAITLAAGLLLLVGAPVWAADPPYYTRQSTWQETLLASVEAQAKYEAEHAKAAKKGQDLHEELWPLLARDFTDAQSKR